jgi:hypothetical protein
MDLSRTKLAPAVYILGLAGPALLVGVLALAERVGLHLGVGGGLIALLSFGACIIGAALMQRATVWKKLILVLVALVAIPLEMLALGIVFVVTNGLTGTQ